ncbi:MAG: FAD-dependent oxidoreductase [Kiritimatiellae bacterium]|nr:FAD-dependent oxidoreductase [Kiritimatiellia bacterium]
MSDDSSRNLLNSWRVASSLVQGLVRKIKVVDQSIYLYIAHTGTVVMVDGPAPVYDYDVVVIGGGSAGFGAAYSAAKLGAKTALVEREHLLGGNSTICGVNNWEPGVGGTGVCYRLYQRMTQITNSIAVMSQDRHLSTYDPATEPYRFPGGLYVPDPTKSYADSLRRYGLSGTEFHNVSYEYQVMSDVMIQMLEETGCCTLYISNACVTVANIFGCIQNGIWLFSVLLQCINKCRDN